MSRRIVLGIVVWALAGAVGCSGDDDGSGGGAGGSGANSDGSGTGDSGSGSGSSGSGSGNGTSGSGSGSSGSGSGTSGTGSDPGASGSSAGGGTGGSGSTAGIGGTAGSGSLVDLPLTQCTDGVDNDGDGTMDGFDVECTGPYDDDEGTFATGIPGDNIDPKWQDCFFDGDSGAGNDGCRYSTDCLTGGLPQSDDDCSVTQMCKDFCEARTPPGCDCFGCCTVATDAGLFDVVIGVDCDVSDFDTCTTCTKSSACGNECGECELCTGVTVNDLPDDCFMKYPPPAGSGGSGGTGGSGSSGTGGSGSSGTGGSGSSGTGGSGSSGTGGSGGSPPPGYTCDNNAQLCRDQTECPPGYYCTFGCCKVIPPI